MECSCVVVVVVLCNVVCVVQCSVVERSVV